MVRSHLFKSLGDEGRRELLSSGFVMRFETDDVVVQEGAPGDVMYLVMDGKVRVETRAPSGTVQLAELGRGACLGEVSVLTGGVRTATVTAATEVTAVVFARHRIQRILDAHPKVRALLDQLIEARAKQTVEKILGGS